MLGLFKKVNLSLLKTVAALEQSSQRNTAPVVLRVGLETFVGSPVVLTPASQWLKEQGYRA